jgi:hypothetical protein
MSEQPEALRLADALEVWTLGKPTHHREAAAELRRLHAENVLLHERHHFDNGFLKELLEALKLALPQLIGRAERTARAAIAKAEG